jgi:hypothetical protein
MAEFFLVFERLKDLQEHKEGRTYWTIGSLPKKIVELGSSEIINL